MYTGDGINEVTATNVTVYNRRSISIVFMCIPQVVHLPYIYMLTNPQSHFDHVKSEMAIK